jgi:hypothetical protein
MMVLMAPPTITSSPFGSIIRLTEERWEHIVGRHPELAGMRMAVVMTVAAPQAVVQGGAGDRLAVRDTGTGTWLVVAYKETPPQDGFVITAFLTSRIIRILRRPTLWPPKT